MNRSPIEWLNDEPGRIGMTWNPVTGCLHGCPYCWARTMAHRFHRNFKPEFHEERLNEPFAFKKPAKIFVTSMGDMWGEWVPVKWINDVLVVVRDSPRNEFYFLTKNPKRYTSLFQVGPYTLSWSDNYWLGITLTGEEADDTRLAEFQKVKWDKKFISFEPLFAFRKWDLTGIKKVFIGGLTGRNASPADREGMDYLISECKRLGIYYLIKKNAVIKGR
jgi:protein gp37